MLYSLRDLFVGQLEKLVDTATPHVSEETYGVAIVAEAFSKAGFGDNPLDNLHLYWRYEFIEGVIRILPALDVFDGGYLTYVWGEEESSDSLFEAAGMKPIVLEGLDRIVMMTVPDWVDIRSDEVHYCEVIGKYAFASDVLRLVEEYVKGLGL